MKHGLASNQTQDLLMLASYHLQWVEDLTRLRIPGAIAALEADPCQNVCRNVATAMRQFSKPDAMACDD